jgi:predicted kinase
MRVTILRGISGSGKSTWAKTQAPQAYVVSTDTYFIQPDGSIQFDGSKLKEFHGRAFRDFMEAVFRKEPWIVVDNTNILMAEFAPYVAVAEAYDYQVEILTLACSVETAQARKRLVAEWKVRKTFKELHEETLRFPRYLAEIHRVIACE